jgi:hypothetical protein
MTKKRYPKNVNEVLVVGTVSAVKMWDGQYPALSVLVDDSIWIRVRGVKKDGPFYQQYEALRGLNVVVQCILNSWEKEGKTNYGLQCYESGLTAIKEGEPLHFTDVRLIGQVKRAEPWQKGHMLQIGTRYKIPKENTWKDRFARVHIIGDAPPVGAMVYVYGQIIQDKDILYVNAGSARRID